MKKHLPIAGFVLSLLGLAVPPLAAQEVRVSGSLGADSDSVQVLAARLMLSSARPSAYEQYTLPANEVELSLRTDAPVYVMIRGESVRVPPLLLEPGADLRLRLVDGAVVASGSGIDGPAFMLEGEVEPEWQRVQSEMYDGLQAAAGEVDFEAYLARVDSLRDAMDRRVQEAALSPLYERVLMAENFARAHRMTRWAMAEMEPEEAEATRVELLEDALAVAGGDTLAYAMRYTEVLGNLLNEAYRDLVLQVGGETSNSGFYHFTKSAVSGPLLQRVMLAALLDSMLRSEDFDPELAGLVADFSENLADGPYGVYIEGRAADRQALAPGQEAPELNAVTLEGETITNDDLHGMVTLVTAWGSWCGWSRAELPWLETVRRRLADEEVVFLNLGWDESEEPWREVIREQSLGGLHVLTDEDLRDAWGLVKTPTFILLDRDGTIITVEPPRPSQDGGRALEAAIREALEG